MGLCNMLEGHIDGSTEVHGRQPTGCQFECERDTPGATALLDQPYGVHPLEVALRIGGPDTVGEELKGGRVPHSNRRLGHGEAT